MIEWLTHDKKNDQNLHQRQWKDWNLFHAQVKGLVLSSQSASSSGSCLWQRFWGAWPVKLWERESTPFLRSPHLKKRLWVGSVGFLADRTMRRGTNSWFWSFWWWKRQILTQFIIYITSVNLFPRAALTSLCQSATLAKILTYAVNVTKPEEVKAWLYTLAADGRNRLRYFGTFWLLTGGNLSRGLTTSSTFVKASCFVRLWQWCLCWFLPFLKIYCFKRPSQTGKYKHTYWREHTILVKPISNTYYIKLYEHEWPYSIRMEYACGTVYSSWCWCEFWWFRLLF